MFVLMSAAGVPAVVAILWKMLVERCLLAADVWNLLKKVAK